MGLLPSGKRALKVSLQAFILSIVLSLFLPWQFRIGGSIGRQILTQISIFIMTAGVSFCLEISHHFVQVSSLQSVSDTMLVCSVSSVWSLTNLVCY
jgi:nucleoporin NDC1